MSDTTREQIKQLINELSEILKKIPDSEINDALEGGLILKPVFQSLFDPTSTNRRYIDILLENRSRSAIIAVLYHSIIFNYAVRVEVDNFIRYISPSHIQWFNDGVMFLEGEKPFDGLIGLFQNGKVGYMVAARDIRPDEMLGPEAFQFLEIEEFKASRKSIPIE